MALKIWPPIDSSHNVDNGWIIDMIEKEWPETARLWNKRRRCDELCKSPEAKEWQCGCLGPEGCYCHRLRNHQGQCSDLLNEEDRQSLVKKIKALQKEELRHQIELKNLLKKNLIKSWAKNRVNREVLVQLI